jgi:hypothetical protein
MPYVAYIIEDYKDYVKEKFGDISGSNTPGIVDGIFTPGEYSEDALLHSTSADRYPVLYQCMPDNTSDNRCSSSATLKGFIIDD